MNQRERGDNLDVIEDESILGALDDLRAAYVRDELPRVGAQLAAVFAQGVAGQGEVNDALRRPSGRTIKHRRRVPSRALLAGLGAAVLSVNLAGVGSAGWLPGPLQASFERVTRSLGVEVPAAPGGRTRGPVDDRRVTPTVTNPENRSDGETRRAPANGSGPSPVDPQPREQERSPGTGSGGTGGERDRPNAVNPTNPANPATSSVTAVPTTVPAAPPSTQAPSSDPPGVPCLPGPAPGPTLPTLPPVTTTVHIPVPPNPNTTLPVTPPACPR